MTLDDLEPHEQLAFAGLVRMLTKMDGVLTQEETMAVADIARGVGSPAFWTRMAEAQAELATPQSVAAAAEQVTRPEVRRFIFETLHVLAAADGVDVAETQMLDWLGRAWELAAPPAGA